ncbi:Protein of unknown function (DUF630 and DUF632 [Striga hermonthica]|uniref:Uncharacterized protein n=1 Tax=Striga hermonthica TaxID=68872 RepID=A0A9N7RL23_STRHE|nr:Protein of unknown function (DUF630 and DUF632 [Striga hermonthica]
MARSRRNYFAAQNQIHPDYIIVGRILQRRKISPEMELANHNAVAVRFSDSICPNEGAYQPAPTCEAKMGSGASKADTELVKLCRERKEFIIAARDSRDSLAFSHMMFLESMQNVQNELKNFMEEVLVFRFDLDSDAGIHHLPINIATDSENSSVKSYSDEDEDELLPLNNHVDEALKPSETQSENVSGEVPPSDDFVAPPKKNEISKGVSTYKSSSNSAVVKYERWDSTDHWMDLPLDTFRPSQNFGFDQDTNGTSLGIRAGYAVANTRFFQHERGSPDHYMMDIPSDDAENYWILFGHQSSRHLGQEVSTWDYINPFNVVEDIFPSFYPHGSHLVDYMGNDMDLSEMGDSEEGIPDLEDELGNPILEDSLGEGNLKRSENSEEYLSEAVTVKDANDDCLNQKEELGSSGDGPTNIRSEKIDETVKEKELESSGDGSTSNGDGPTNIRNEKIDEIEKEDSGHLPTSSEPDLKVKEMEESKICNGEEDSFHKEMEKSKAREGQLSSSQTDESLVEIVSKLSANSSSDLREVVTEIKVAFHDIIVHGKNVSIMLGPCHTGIAVNKGLCCSSCIEDLAASPREISSRPTYRMLKMTKDSNENLDNEPIVTSNNLTLTLEKLCIWENKLYEEVKKEEKLRQSFDKEWRKLKKLDDKGAESSKVDACNSELKRLTAIINVSVSTVEGIAKRTNTIRDEELHPQLRELIQRVHTMWSYAFESHKKQVQAISKAQAKVVVTTCKAHDSGLKATENLEAWIHNLCTAFSECAKSHRALALHLNNWLSKFLPQQPEQTPELFAMCSEWHNAVEGVSENDVLQALNTFGQLLRQLCVDMQDEERQRMRIGHLSGYHDRKLRSFCLHNGLDWEKCASFIQEVGPGIETGFSSLHALYANLKPIRIKLAEARGKHEEALTRVRASGVGIIRDGLAPVLEALERFSLGMLNAFQQIRTLS